MDAIIPVYLRCIVCSLKSTLIQHMGRDSKFYSLQGVVIVWINFVRNKQGGGF